jgi:hypothetical protein
MSTGTVLGLTGAGIVAVSAVYYAVDVLRGGTRPQRTSWGVWALVGILGVASSNASGAGPGMYAAAVDAVACAATFLLSLIPRYRKPGGQRLDPYLGLAAVAGVVLWQFGPLTAAGAAICAVTCATVALWPTLRDARYRPDLESRLSWSTDVVGNGLCLAAVGTASVAALVYPIFLVVAAVAMTTVLLTAPALQRPGELADPVVDLAHALGFSRRGSPAFTQSSRGCVVPVRPDGGASHSRPPAPPSQLRNTCSWPTQSISALDRATEGLPDRVADFG